MIDTDYIYKVIESCVSKSQLDSVLEWSCRLMKRPKGEPSGDIWTRVESRFQKITYPKLVVGDTYIVIRSDGEVVFVGSLRRLMGYGSTYATLQNDHDWDDISVTNATLYKVTQVPQLWWLVKYGKA